MTETKPTTELFAALDKQPEKTHIALENYPKLLAALEEIWRDTGRVCVNFELCKHGVCRSSYTAWAIADDAIVNERERIERSREMPDDKQRQEYVAFVTCMNCGTSGTQSVAKGTTIKDAITEGLKCPWCDCPKLKPNTPRGRPI